MASQDFTLSYTISELLTWIEHSEGQIGPTSTIFADVVSLENIGPTSTIFADITTLENIGATSTMSTSAIAATLSATVADIIHYSQDGSIETDTIELQDDITVKANFPARTWQKQSNRIEVIVCETNLNLAPNNSNALITNGTSGSGLTYNLPEDAQEGIIYTVVNTSTSGTISVSSQASVILSVDNILVNSSADLNSIGSKIRLQSNGQDEWVVLSSENVDFIGFKPSQVAGLSLHLDATASGSIDTSTSFPDVDQWSDLSGSGNHVSQSSAALKPHATGLINGFGAITFDGIDDLLINSTAGGTFNGNIGDIFCVVQLNPGADAAAILASSDETLSTIRLFVRLQQPGDARILQRNADTQDQVSTDDFNVSAPTVLRFNSDGTSYGISISGIDQTITVDGGTNSGDWFADTPSRDNFSIGGLRTTIDTQWFGGEIGEVIYYENKVLTNLESQRLISSLQSKWGIT